MRPAGLGPAVASIRREVRSSALDRHLGVRAGRITSLLRHRTLIAMVRTVFWPPGFRERGWTAEVIYRGKHVEAG